MISVAARRVLDRVGAVSWRALPVEHRLHLFVAVVLSTAAFVGAFHLTAAVEGPLPAPAHLVLVAVFPARLRARPAADALRRQPPHLHLGRTGVIMGLVLLPLPWVALMATASCALVHLCAGRGLVKASFMGASAALGVTAGGPVLGLLTDGAPVVTTSVACCRSAWPAWSTAPSARRSARPWSRLAQDMPVRAVVRSSGPVFAIVAAGNIAVAAFVLLLEERSPVALMALPPVMFGVYLLYRGYLGAMQERDVWRQLEAATRELNLLEESDVASAALRRASHLFRTDRVELHCSTAPAAGPAHVATPGSCAGGRSLARESARLPRPAARRHLPGGAAREPARAGRVAAAAVRRRVSFSARERPGAADVSRTPVSTTVLNAALYDEARCEAARHAHSAHHDALTGLANRTLLTPAPRPPSRPVAARRPPCCCSTSTTSRRSTTPSATRRATSAAGIGARTAPVRAASDVVARLGGDELRAAADGLDDPAEAEPVAESLLRLLAEPVEFEGLRLSVEGSVGVACHPQDAADRGGAVSGGPTSRCTRPRRRAARGCATAPSATTSSIHRQALVAELRAALERDQLVVHYQPLVDLETGLVVAAEALCRWQHPTRGSWRRVDFVAVVEQSGLVRPFTQWVLDAAVAECVTWQPTAPSRSRSTCRPAACSTRSCPTTSPACSPATACRRTG
jgi:hypothetical protein